jgi:RNA recognition motif-containing protein
MNRLYVGNVSTKVDSSELKQLMEDCGKIKHFDIKEGSGFMVYFINKGI